MSMDSEALAVTSSILRFVGPANKSLGGAHRNWFAWTSS